MMTAHQDDTHMLGLRERKKIKTRAAIEKHAFKLFAEHGYEATTIEQIAEAAEVSPSTFFRYFPAKEDVVLSNMPNLLVIDMFGEQPQDLSPISALRAAVCKLQTKLSAEELVIMQKRLELVHAVPELKALAFKEFAKLRERLSELIGERVGRKADDFDVIIFTGAIIGIWIAIIHTVKNSPNLEEFPNLFDKALAQLEDGLRL